MKRIHCVAAGVLIGATFLLANGVGTAQAAPVINNGGFEIVGGTPCDGWSFGGGAVCDTDSSYASAPFAALIPGGTGNPTVMQTVSGFAPNDTWILSYGVNTDASDNTGLSVSVTDSNGVSPFKGNTTVEPTKCSTNATCFIRQAFSFTTTSANDLTFTFESGLNGVTNTYNIDDVSIFMKSVINNQKVPAPPALAVFLFGLAGLGLLRRRTVAA